jgi:pyridoxal phosphate enzyme (YggS family)
MIMGNASNIAENYQKIMNRITVTAEKAGRDSEDVKLLVVTKGQPAEKMIEAYESGARLFGENCPDETAGKLDALSKLDGIEIHMIGHLQSRKARIVAGSFDLMHSIDRVSIAEKLDRELQAAGCTLPILLEMNVSGEDSKQGFPAWDKSTWDGLFPEIEQIASYKSLSIRGLMTMPPLSVDPSQIRPYFSLLRELLSHLAVQFNGIQWTQLSMGTSSDFETAIQEGATYIRVGTAIMGPRPPKKLFTEEKWD